MVKVEIEQMDPFFLEVINNGAIVKVFSDETSFLDKDVDIINDVECVNDLNCWQRTKPVTRGCTSPALSSLSGRKPSPSTQS